VHSATETTGLVTQFPKGFLWGAATAAHQVEGNNVNSDLWVLEHVEPTLFAEPSLDACDHLHRYPEDIGLLAGLGLNTFTAMVRRAGRLGKTCFHRSVCPVLRAYRETSGRPDIVCHYLQ